MVANEWFASSRTDFTIVSIGEHGSPLQYNNNSVTFIKSDLIYNLYHYLRLIKNI